MGTNFGSVKDQLTSPGCTSRHSEATSSSVSAVSSTRPRNGACSFTSTGRPTFALSGTVTAIHVGRSGRGVRDASLSSGAQ